MNRKSILCILVCLGLAAGAYLCFSTVLTANHKPYTTDKTADVSTPDETITSPTDTVVSGKYNFDVVKREDWPLTERAEAAIASLAAGQFISGVVEDPTQENTAYFAASTEIAADGSRLLSVYRYHTDNYNWERLFRGTYKQGEFSALCDTCYPTLTTAGYDSGKIILIARDNDYGGGLCWFPFVDSVERRSESITLVSMDIEKPYNGFEEYTPPDEALDEALRERDACEAELE